MKTPYQKSNQRAERIYLSIAAIVITIILAMITK